MRHRDLRKQTFAICIIIFLAVAFLSGCTDTKNIENSLNRFIGMWTGSMEISTFGPMGNITITKLTFVEYVVTVTLSNERGVYTMNYTYALNGENLVLEPAFNGGMPGRQPFNGTRPSFNDTWSPNGTRPFNDTRPPFNDTWQPNGQHLPDGQRPTMSLSFSYSFDKNYTVLYLDGVQFKKVL